MPCSTLEVAVQGARKINAAIMTLTPTKLQIRKQLRDSATTVYVLNVQHG